MGTLIKTNHSNEASEQYFPMVLFILLYKMVQTIESVDEILKCDHSNESCQPRLDVVNQG